MPRGCFLKMTLDLQYSLAKPGIDVGSQRGGKLMVQKSVRMGTKTWGGEAKKKNKSQDNQLRMPSVWKLEKYLGKYSQTRRRA